MICQKCLNVMLKRKDADFMKGYPWNWENMKHSYWEIPCDMVVGCFTLWKSEKQKKF